MTSIKHLVTVFEENPTFDTFFYPQQLSIFTNKLTALSIGRKRLCAKESFMRQELSAEKLPSNADLDAYMKSRVREKIVSEIREVQAKKTEPHRFFFHRNKFR